MDQNRPRIGFVSTRFAGTDGVTLETRKWVSVLDHLGYTSYFFAGECDWPAERSVVVDEAHFAYPEITALNADLFDDYQRSSETSGKIQALRYLLKRHLYRFIEKFDIALLVVENALAIPMNIPLGMALTELIAETGIPTIAHHHDFAWERTRFKVSAASDYQWGAFPPVLPSVHHVVINSYAARQLALRTGISSTLIPNVMDFDAPLTPPDDYAGDFRQELQIPQDSFLLLQPTRIVPRKRIELAIQLARRLELPCVLLVSHASGDEGVEYANHLQSYAKLLGVDMRYASNRIAFQRGLTSTGAKIYSLADVYSQAHMVTYPSTVEGFGNAFLEAIYYRRPILMRTYEIFRTDIQPKGFKVIGFGDYLTQSAVDEVRYYLQNPAHAQEATQHNFELGRRYYSFHVLEHRLRILLNQTLGTW